jgi:opacity protein-like surface antigen
MKTALFTVSIMVATATASLAQGFYVSGGGGASIVSSSDLYSQQTTTQGVTPITTGDNDSRSYRKGLGVIIGAGYDFEGIRVEGEYGYRVSPFKETITNYDVSPAPLSIRTPTSTFSREDDLTIHSSMVNGYFDIDVKGPVFPIIGVGVGVLSGSVKNATDMVLGWQLTAGIAYQALPNCYVDLFYRLQTAFSDLHLGVDVPYISNNIFVGVRYAFGAVRRPTPVNTPVDQDPASSPTP